MISYPSPASHAQSDDAFSGVPAITSSDELMRAILRGLKSQRLLASESAPAAVSQSIAWESGSPLCFGKGLSGNHLLLKGWSYPEANFVWSDGDFAEMLIPAYPSAGASLIKFEVWPFCYAPSVTQNVRIHLGDRLVGVWNFASPGSACLILPPPVADNQSLKLIWEFPNARSPREVGLNGDPRKLAVAVHTVSLFSLKSLTSTPLAHN